MLTESLFGPACNRPWGQLRSLPGGEISAVRETDRRFRNVEGWVWEEHNSGQRKWGVACRKEMTFLPMRMVRVEVPVQQIWNLWFFCCWLYSSWSPGEGSLSLHQKAPWELYPPHSLGVSEVSCRQWNFLPCVYFPFLWDFLRRIMISSF